MLDGAPDHVELALEVVLVLDGVTGADEELGDPGRDRTAGRAAGALVDGHLAPAEHALSLRLDALLQEPHGLGGVAGR